MTVSTYRAAEALYLIIIKNNNAEKLLRDWVKKHQVQHSAVAGNRLSIFSSHAFDLFKLTWAHDFSNVTVWDTWRRCHIYLE